MNNQIQTCKCGCFVFDAECKKCVMCGAERPGTNNPQDNVSKGENSIINLEYFRYECKYKDSQYNWAILKIDTSSCDVLIQELNRDAEILWVSAHDIEPAQSRIAELEKQNSELREALTNVMYPKLSDNTNEASEQWTDILNQAEQALNNKE